MLKWAKSSRGCWETSVLMHYNLHRPTLTALKCHRTVDLISGLSTVPQGDAGKQETAHILVPLMAEVIHF